MRCCSSSPKPPTQSHNVCYYNRPSNQELFDSVSKTVKLFSFTKGAWLVVSEYCLYAVVTEVLSTAACEGGFSGHLPAQKALVILHIINKCTQLTGILRGI